MSYKSSMTEEDNWNHPKYGENGIGLYKINTHSISTFTFHNALECIFTIIYPAKSCISVLLFEKH